MVGMKSWNSKVNQRLLQLRIDILCGRSSLFVPIIRGIIWGVRIAMVLLRAGTGGGPESVTASSSLRSWRPPQIPFPRDCGLRIPWQLVIWTPSAWFPSPSFSFLFRGLRRSIQGLGARGFPRCSLWLEPRNLQVRLKDQFFLGQNYEKCAFKMNFPFCDLILDSVKVEYTPDSEFYKIEAIVR